MNFEFVEIPFIFFLLFLRGTLRFEKDVNMFQGRKN